MADARLWRRGGGIAGLLLIGIAGAILVVSLLSNPWFSFRHSSISDLGRRSAQFGALYDAGLLVVCVLFVVFLVGAYREWEDRLYRLGLGLFGSTGIALLLVGFRANGVNLPDAYAIAFAVGGATGVGLLGVGLMRRGVAYARLLVALVVPGTVVAVVAIGTFEGLAIAEFLAIGGYVSIVGALAVRLLGGAGESVRGSP